MDICLQDIDKPSELDEALQQLDVFMTTEKFTVFGDTDFGNTFAETLFNASVGSGAMRAAVAFAINRYCPAIYKYKPEIKVSVHDVDYDEVVVVDVVLTTKNISRKYILHND